MTRRRQALGHAAGMRGAQQAQARRGRAHGTRVVGSWASGRAGARGTGARAQRGARQQARQGRVRCERHRRWATCLGAQAGHGCALSAFGLFLARFDSVLFLSQFLDIVREPGS